MVIESQLESCNFQSNPGQNFLEFSITSWCKQKVFMAEAKVVNPLVLGGRERQPAIHNLLFKVFEIRHGKPNC